MRERTAGSRAGAGAVGKEIARPLRSVMEARFWIKSSALPSEAAMLKSNPAGKFPTESGLLFGLGLGGFFDGIVLHQVLQWHHMVSSWYPPTTIENLRLNTLWDGVFHSTTYVFTVVALYLLWKRASRQHIYWSSKLIWGTLLLGWGLFNVVEGVIDHEILGIHHVNELVEPSQRFAWDCGFLAWGAVMLVAGWAIFASGRADQAARVHKGYAAVRPMGQP